DRIALAPAGDGDGAVVGVLDARSVRRGDETGGHGVADVHRIRLVLVRVLARPPRARTERLRQAPDELPAVGRVESEIPAGRRAVILHRDIDGLAGRIGAIEGHGHQVADVRLWARMPRLGGS